MGNSPTRDADKKGLLFQQLNKFQRDILHMCGHVVAPVFRVRAIREYARRRAVIAAGFRNEDYPVLEAKHLDNPRLFANREDLISQEQFKPREISG
jgi:hypothetical protein